MKTNNSKIKIKYLCSQIFAGGTPDTSNPDYWNGDIPWIASGALHNNLVNEPTSFIAKKGLCNSSTKMVPANTALLAMTGATCANVGISTISACYNQSVCSFVNKKNVLPKFLYYCLICERSQILSNQFGGAQAGINVSDCKNILIENVPFERQTKIVDFLDIKVAKIDELLECLKNQIKDLKDYLIFLTNSVLKNGLRKEELKETNIEWIGKIPKSWKVEKIKYNYQLITTKYEFGDYQYIALENIESLTGKYIDTLTNSTYSLNGTIIAKKDDVIFGKLRPYLVKTMVLKSDSCVSSEFAVYRPKKGNLSKFLYYHFLSYDYISVINNSVNGTKMPRASSQFISNLMIALPDPLEQEEIVQYLENKNLQINKLLKIKQDKILELENYKNNLIYECVTGKKEVI